MLFKKMDKVSHYHNSYYYITELRPCQMIFRKNCELQENFIKYRLLFLNLQTVKQGI